MGGDRIQLTRKSRLGRIDVEEIDVILQVLECGDILAVGEPVLQCCCQLHQQKWR